LGGSWEFKEVGRVLGFVVLGGRGSPMNSLVCMLALLLLPRPTGAQAAPQTAARAQPERSLGHVAPLYYTGESILILFTITP